MMLFQNKKSECLIPFTLTRLDSTLMTTFDCLMVVIGHNPVCHLCEVRSIYVLIRESYNPQ